MKKKFVIAIEETVSQEFSVYAENADEAVEIAIKKYDAGNFVLEPGNLVCKQISIVEPSGEAAE